MYWSRENIKTSRAGSTPGPSLWSSVHFPNCPSRFLLCAGIRLDKSDLRVRRPGGDVYVSHTAQAEPVTRHPALIEETQGASQACNMLYRSWNSEALVCEDHGASRPVEPAYT